MSNSFLFVSVDSPSQRKQKGRPAGQEYATAARKHVMRDIGQARRKDKPIKQRASKIFELEMVRSAPNAAPSYHAILLSDSLTNPASRTCEWETNLGEAFTEDQEAARARYQHVAAVARRFRANTSTSLPPLALSLGSGRLDPFTKYPVPMTDRVKFLLDICQSPHTPRKKRLDASIEADSKSRLVLDEGCRGLRSFRIAWYPLASIDAGAFNQALAISAVHLGKMRQRPDLLETEAIRFHNAALASVNSKLRDPACQKDDGVVASIVGFACHGRQTGEYDNWAMHLGGLKRILDGKGGVDSIKIPRQRQALTASFEAWRGFDDLPLDANLWRHGSYRA